MRTDKPSETKRDSIPEGGVTRGELSGIHSVAG